MAVDRVTEKANEEAPSHAEQLKPLEWMIGRWVDKDDKVDITTDCQWTKNRNFINRSFTVVADGEISLSGMQIVGWTRPPRPSAHGHLTPTAVSRKASGL